jgi:threonine dehydrogenase-like Zn-dependent dehydrogenase
MKFSILNINHKISVLGHEACVEVVDHRRTDSDLCIGDRVTFSIADTCGSCEFCQNDLSQKCTKLFKVILFFLSLILL